MKKISKVLLTASLCSAAWLGNAQAASYTSTLDLSNVETVTLSDSSQVAASYDIYRTDFVADSTAAYDLTFQAMQSVDNDRDGNGSSDGTFDYATGQVSFAISDNAQNLVYQNPSLLVEMSLLLHTATTEEQKQTIFDTYFSQGGTAWYEIIYNADLDTSYSMADLLGYNLDLQAGTTYYLLVAGGQLGSAAGWVDFELDISEAEPVPVPAAAWLLGSGLLGLIGLRRRQPNVKN